jgi:fluoride exporter
MTTVLWIGFAGFFGAIARYGVAGLVSRVDESFPWGTFVVNVSGCFLLGLLVAMFAHRFVAHPDVRIALTVGFLGSYTTFSTFALETFGFGETNAPGHALLNVGASVIAGVLAVWAGTALGRSL